MGSEMQHEAWFASLVIEERKKRGFSLKDAFARAGALGLNSGHK